ncbi:MAG: hypothetical protein ACP5GJ_03965 [Nanopusillaceae archaeon]
MDKRKILILSLLGLGILGIPVFSQNELTVTNMSVYVIPVLNFTFNTFTYNGTNVFAVSQYTYNGTPYILTVLGSNYPLSVDLFNITGGLVASEDISSLVQYLINLGYTTGSFTATGGRASGNIFIYEYNNTAYIDIPFYQYSESFYTGSYTSLYLYQITVNGNNISSPQLVSNATISGDLSNIYFINTPENNQYIISSLGIYSPNGTLLLNLSVPIYGLYTVSPTANNIYIDYGSYSGGIFSLADINLNNGQLYIFYNNTNSLYGYPAYLSTYYPNDYAIAVNTPDWDDIIVNTTLYNLSATYCSTFGEYPGWIYDNYYGQLSVYQNLSISVFTFNITNDTFYCSPYVYNNSNLFIVPNFNSAELLPGNIHPVTPIYYNGSDIFLFGPIAFSGGPSFHLFDFNIVNDSVGYMAFDAYCVADNYLITCTGNGNTTIYVVSGQPLTPTPTQIYYTVPAQVPTCYPQQFNYTNFTAYLLHIFNVTFDQSSLSGVNVFYVYPYTYNNSPYMLAVIGTEYPQLVSLFNITGGLVASENISSLVQNLTNQGYTLDEAYPIFGNIFAYEYNDTAYISLPFSTTNNYLLYEITVTGNNISSPQLVSSIYNPNVPYYSNYYVEVDNYTIYAGDFMNTSTGEVETILNITQGNIPVISINSGYSQPYNPMYVDINFPIYVVETKDYVYIIFDTGQSTNGNQYLFIFAINKATGQIFTLINGTEIASFMTVSNIEYYDDVVSMTVADIAGKQVSILIVGNLSTIVPESNILVNGEYVIGYNAMLNYNNMQYTCINMNIYNYTVQGDNIILNLINQSSMLDTFGSNISSPSYIGLGETGYIPVAFANPSNNSIYSMLTIENFSFINYASVVYGAQDELEISPASGQYSYIQLWPYYQYMSLDVDIIQECFPEGYLIDCTLYNSNTSTTETDIYVLSALNLTPTPVSMLLTTPTAPLQYTIPTQSSSPSPSPTPSPTPTTTAPTPAPTTSTPSVSVPTAYSTTSSSTTPLSIYGIFVAAGVGIVLVGWYYARRKYLG